MTRRAPVDSQFNCGNLGDVNKLVTKLSLGEKMPHTREGLIEAIVHEKASNPLGKGCLELKEIHHMRFGEVYKNKKYSNDAENWDIYLASKNRLK